MKVGVPLVIEIEGFHAPYTTPPLPPLNEISGYELPEKNQKWRRPILPTDNEILHYSKDEKAKIIKEDLYRRIYGYWFMNNSEPVYITGSHYFFLTHWYMAAVNKDGYPDYRRASRDMHYVMDFGDNDENCFGIIMMSQKRFSKTEASLSDLYNTATRGGVRRLKGEFIDDSDCLFGLQSLTATEAKNNLFKSRLMRSHMKIQNYLKPVSNETNSRREIVGELTFKGENLGGGKYKDALRNVIDHRPTLVSAYQGKRPRKIFIDEPGSIEEMDLLEWWSTVKQQLALGVKAFGKALLPTTLESMTPKGAAAFKKLWEDSDPTDLDKNGRTKSWLYRYFNAQYYGREDFIDEYGNDLVEEAKTYRQNEIDHADEAGVRKIKRQYPETVEEAFDVDFGGQLEAEAREILNQRLIQLKREDRKGFPYTIIEYNGEIKLVPQSKVTAKCVIIFEHPKDNIEYAQSIDGTGTTKETTDNKAKKSKFAISITKKFDPDPDCGSYCDVAEFVIEPENSEECYRISVLLSKYYDKFGKLKVLPEGNIGTAPAIVGYYRSAGCLNLMAKQPKFMGTDSNAVLDRYCFYRDGTVMKTQLFLLNMAVKMYGHHFNSIRLIEDLLKLGISNIDLGSAFQGAILLWGGFAKTIKKEEKKREHWITKTEVVGGKRMQVMVKV